MEPNKIAVPIAVAVLVTYVFVLLFLLNKNSFKLTNFKSFRILNEMKDVQKNF